MNRFQAFLLVFLTVSILRAQNAEPGYGLQDCLAYGLANSFVKQESDLQRSLQQEKMQEAKGKWLPRVDAMVKYQQFFDLPTTVFPEDEGFVLSEGAATGPYPLRLGQKSNLNLGFSLSQPVFDRKWTYAHNQKEVYEELMSLKESLTEDEIIYRIGIQYFEVLSTQRKKEVITFNIERLESLKSVVQLQVENDFAKSTDLDRLVVKIKNLQTQLARAKAGIDQQKNLLKFLMGKEIEEAFMLNLEHEPIPMVEEGNFQPNQLNAFRLMDKRRQLQTFEVYDIQSSYFPQVNLFASVQYQYMNNGFTPFEGDYWFPLNYVGLGMDIPVFHGFSKRSQLQQSSINGQLLGLQRKRGAYQMNLAYKNADIQLENSQKSAADQNENLLLAKRIYDQVKLQYQEGVATLSSLLDAEGEYREAEINYYVAYYEHEVAKIEFLKASGNLRSLLDQD